MTGTLARVGVAEGLGSPWATLLVNVLGALLLGYVVVALPARRPLLGTGFCGGLTTFSTLQLEALELSAPDAVAYLAASAVLGWLAVAAGQAARVSLATWIGIALLGGLGAVARDLLERRTSLLVVNVLGSFVLGAIGGGHALIGHGLPRRLHVLQRVGAGGPPSRCASPAARPRRLRGG